VRKVSKLVVEIPLSPNGSGKGSPPMAAAGRGRSPACLQRRPSKTEVIRSCSSPSKRVRFKEDFQWDPLSPTGKVFSSLSSPDGTPSPLLQRSVKKMDALYDLRRAGKADAAEAAALPPPLQAAAEVAATTPGIVPAGGTTPVTVPLATDIDPFADETDGDEAFMYVVLRDLTDTEEALLTLVGGMSSGLEKAADNGGARHATAVISGRTLAVAKRKAALLHDVEGRITDFRAAHEQREHLLPQIVADTKQAPAVLGGIRKLISSYTHRPGEPADENKSQFARFAQTFKLPRAHEALERLRDLAEEAADFWAEACLSEAEKGHGHAVIRRLYDIAIGTGVDEDHPKLLRAIKILNDRLAERVLQEAKERQQRDTLQEERGPPPKAGQASILGDKIEQDIFAAVAEGVPQADPRLTQALAICKALRQKDGERRRLEAREKRLAEAKAKAKAAP